MSLIDKLLAWGQLLEKLSGGLSTS